MSSFVMYETPAGEQRILWFAATTSINGEFGADVTENPVEESADVTDHVRVLNPLTEMTVLVSQEPIYSLEEIRAALGGTASKIVGAYSGRPKQAELHPDFYEPSLFPAGGLPTPGSLLNAATSALGALLFGKTKYEWAPLTFSVPFNAVRDFTEELEYIQAKALDCTIVMTHRVARNCILQKFSESREPQYGRGAEYKLSWKRITKASTLRVKTPKPAIPRATPKASNGKKGPGGTDKKPEDSVAFKGLQSFGVFE